MTEVRFVDTTLRDGNRSIVKYFAPGETRAVSSCNYGRIRVAGTQY